MSTAHSTTRRVSIYFIQVGESGPIKIGRSSSGVRGRIVEIQVGCPFPVRWLAEIPEAKPSREMEIHRRFRQLRLIGEWFRPAPELIEFIAREAECRLSATMPKVRRFVDPAEIESVLSGMMATLAPVKVVVVEDVAPAPRRGRPSPSRSEMLRCLSLRKTTLLSRRAIAAELKVSEKTVERWCRVAKAFPEARQILADDSRPS